MDDDFLKVSTNGWNEFIWTKNEMPSLIDSKNALNRIIRIDELSTPLILLVSAHLGVRNY